MAAEREPDLVTAEFKRGARGGRVFLDFTRTGMGQHVVAPYSPRARPGGPVSFPVPWEGLEHADPLDFTIRTAPKLLERGDLWGSLCPDRQSLPRSLIAG